MTKERPGEDIRIRHCLPGRLRLQVPALFRQQGLAGFLARELAVFPGVLLVRAEARTGNLLVCFSPGEVAPPALLREVGRAVNAWRQAGSRPGKIRESRESGEGSPAPEVLAALTAGLAWYWGRGALGLGLVCLAALSHLGRGSVPPRLARRINLMAGLTAAGGAVLHLTGRDRGQVLAGLIAGNPLGAGTSACQVAVARLAERGIVVKDARTLLAAGGIDTLVFTAESPLCPRQPGITDVLPADPRYTREDILYLLEQAHVAGEARTGPANLNLCARIGGRSVCIGTAAYMKKARVPLVPVDHQARRVALNGGVPLFVAVDGAVAAVIGVEQRIGLRGQRELAELRALGIRHVEFLTGEDAGWLNGGDPATSFLTATGKERHVAKLQARGHRVAVVGAGPADGPALNRADLAVVPGGTPAPSGRTPPVIVERPGTGSSLRELFLQAKDLRDARPHNFLTAVGGNLAGLALAAAGRLGAGWALALAAYSVTRAACNRYRERGRPLGPVEAAAAGKEPERVIRTSPQAPASPVPSWHSLTPDEVLAALKTSGSGLSPAQVTERLFRHGYNELPPPPLRPWWRHLHAQLADFMVQLLLGVAGISALTGRTVDALAVVAIVLANAGVGVFQEMRAAGSLAALRGLTPGRARVWRDGREKGIAARELVPGDLVLLTAGDQVPADLRLLADSNLEVEESSLTGETLPVPKGPEAVPPEAPLTERTCLLYAGSHVVRGRGLGVAVATGPATEIGDIAHSLRDVERGRTTLQTSLAELGRHMAYGCLALSGLVFALGLINRQGFFDMFVTALSLLVSAVPEGLMPMITIGLAMAVFRMSRRNVVVRRLTAVETLGCVTAICVDKTGTLTRNEMTVRRVWAGGLGWLVTGEGYDPRGGFRPDLRAGYDHRAAQEDLNHLLLTGVLCNNARLLPDRHAEDFGGKGRVTGGGWLIQGDPTEGALLVAAAKAGPGVGEARWRRVAEEPFEARNRQMTVVCENEAGERILCVKGAPDRVLPRCALYRRDGTVRALQEETRRVIDGVNTDMTASALRVLALAYKDLKPGEDWRSAENLVLAGLAGLQDVPRAGVRDSLHRCRQAGVAVMMITGDHPDTARAVAREIGLLPGGRVLTGDELDTMDDPALDRIVQTIRVCARALPRHKLRLVKSLQRRQHVVAMAGDGVNDAPAVRQADIGLAMGLSGTDLTRAASDLVIGDDNFNTIVRGIEEGRAVYDNIRHAVGYLLYTNAGDVALMLSASFLGLPMPLLPIQLLWINLSGDGLPALAIMADPPVAEQMARPPRPRTESILGGGLSRRIAARGLAIGLAGLVTYRWGLSRYGLPVARTMALGSLGLSQFFHLFDPTIGPPAPNLYKTGAGLSGLALILSSIYIPALRGIFQTTPLAWRHWLPVLLPAAAVPLLNRAAEQPRQAGDLRRGCRQPHSVVTSNVSTGSCQDASSANPPTGPRS